MSDELYDLSDEELEAAFKEAKAQGNSPEDLAVEDEVIEDDVEETLDEAEEEVNEDEEVEELEQPEDQDSDDDTSSDDDEADETDDDSEDAEGKLDGEPEADEEQTDDAEEEAEEDEQPVQEEFLEFKANGQDYKFTVPEMKEQFGKVFGQAMDYTKKMQQIKPWRKQIDALEQNDVSPEQLNLMIDVLKGDKDAIASILKTTGVDALDLDAENVNYVAKDYGRNDTELAIKDIVDEISVDKEYAITHNVLEKQWDDTSREAFIKDPQMIKLLHMDVKSGMYDTINPIAQKLKVYDSGRQSDLDYYKAASQQYFESRNAEQAKAQEAEKAKAEQEAKDAEAQRLAEVKSRQAKQAATKKASAKRKAAAPTKKSAGTKQVNYLEDSDEEFEEWYAKLQGSM